MNTGNNTRAAPVDLPILVTVVICSLPHFLNVSALVILICLVMWCYQGLCLRFRLPVPRLLLRTLMGTLLFMTAVAVNEGLTLEAFISLLIFMISLKVFELKTKRDRIVTVILCYFLIVSCMFFSDSLATFVYALCAIGVTTVALITVNFPRPRLTGKISVTARLSLQALPFMVALFLIFPRVQGGLWGRPPIFSSTSGFSEEITFDSVSRVAQSKEVAARVAFQGRTPEPEQRYWRGIVMSEFDGRSWSESNSRRRADRYDNQDDTRITYRVTLEPTSHRRLFALDLPVAIDAPRVRRLGDHTFSSWRPVNTRLQFTATSLLQARPRAAMTGIEPYRALPETGNSRSRQLAAAWRSESGSTEEFLARAINYFQTSGFSYTLAPGRAASGAGIDAIDAFLFTTRQGFCEHFASAFAFLMRAGGVPARLVAGYLGGEINPYGEYLVIRQSDAHVWCEVLMEDGTWHRVDPTLFAAPGRIRPGLSEGTGQGNVASVLNFQLMGMRLPEWFRNISAYGDMISSSWNNRVLGYSGSDQIQLYSRIGIDLRLPGGLVKALLFGVVLLASCGFIALVVMKKADARPDAAAVHWQKFCAIMQKAGVPRPPFQGPIDYARAISRQQPDLEPAVSEIASLYAQLRYNPNHGDDTMQQFIQRVNSFSVPRRTD
jgi:transglutaminase-like putative cysteine protease